ncbi:MAG: hypothetical protein APF80_16405 [Alphaproteobacteria bacterium BRH_c36]|nr:MAG: hypothetical protein APF80_16405 [Alphaproteobacteria bacterium BRH_c36]
MINPANVAAQPASASAGSAPRTHDARQLSSVDSWRAIINALPEAALTLDTGGMISHQNDLIPALFPEMRVGKAMSQLLRNPDLMTAIEMARTSSGPAIVVKFAERVPVARSIAATVARLEPGLEAASLLVTFRDLTEREKVETMRADFVANASHELRTPLASLIGYIETLQGPARNDPAARERFLGIMWSQAQRMSRLVDDLLSLSRVEMRAHLMPQGRADINEIAAYVVQSLDPLAVQQNTALKLIRLDAPAFVRADREEIVQALQNLIHNALKYGRDNGNVEVVVARQAAASGRAGKLTISVIDDGPGIAAHHLPRLVERFYRVNPASSREKGGTGLGLAIVKHIMARHRGDLEISSEVGRGSTFTLSFDELPTGAK